MTTSYEQVYTWFITKATMYDIVELDDETKNFFLEQYLKSAIVKFKKCKIDLSDRDETLKQFNQKLDDEIIDILSDGMLVEWFRPIYLNLDNMKNTLNTKDFTTFSPANMLSQLRETYKNIQKDFRKKIIDYSYDKADFSTLGGS